MRHLHLLSSFLTTGCPALTAATLASILFAQPAQSQTASQIKWDQPPEAVQPLNVFNGWNQPSMRGDRYAADDWVCTTADLVTGIRWWGSHLGWISDSPPWLPEAFVITIWTDKPKTPTQPWSHPEQAIHQVVCTNFTWRCAGLDYDPRSGKMETCYVYEQDWSREDWFKQEPVNGTNIYWISIEAVSKDGPAVPYPWGWKTRPRDKTSAAPDAAVVVQAPIVPVPGAVFSAGVPLYWPETEEWDLAFGLKTIRDESSYKWEQLPDLSTAGIDVNATRTPISTNVVAEDFKCVASGPITNITIWGSWLRDYLPKNSQGIPAATNVTFKLTLYHDVPMGPGGYSMPGPMVAQAFFLPGQFEWSVYAADISEGFLTPPANYIFPGDTVCHQYTFNFPLQSPFIQDGTPTQPQVYWLSVEADPMGTDPGVTFGWKTSVTNWNDVSVWGHSEGGPWEKLFNPASGKDLSQAFRINTAQTGPIPDLKWSQPPVPVVATNFYYGWDEISRWQGPQIVADDWVCTNDAPVSDIHWWGSFVGWTETNLPPQVPSAFKINIWTDGSGAPDKVVYELLVTGLPGRFVGWDLDPRSRECLQTETCFKWDLMLNMPDWFHQGPGTNVYWISIAAVYPTGSQPQFPWGWKTRPFNPSYTILDPAVRIFDPTAPNVGDSFVNGQRIQTPDQRYWDMAFVLTTPGTQEPLDFGDAPDAIGAAGYPTLLIHNGARHVMVPHIYLGPPGPVGIDSETDGQPNANATGDDIAGIDDENGVSFLQSPLLTGEPASISIDASIEGFVSFWIDWGGDASWAGDLVFSGPVVTGPNLINFTVPADAALGGTFARFRFATEVADVANYTGLAKNGEVEDYQLYIAKEPSPDDPLDFGDAPFGYPTRLADNGPRHVILPGFRLGNNEDSEPDGQPTISADGDDLAGIDDEDGIIFTSPLQRGTNAYVNVFLTSFFGTGHLNAWMDFNRNFTFEPAEQIFTSLPLAVGNNPLFFPVPATAALGRVHSRWRLSAYPALGPTGYFQNGEVEDRLDMICQKPPTNLVVTNITATNILVGGVMKQEVTIQWACEPGGIYQMVSTPSLISPITWAPEGPEVEAPVNSLKFTNDITAHRFYRVTMPNVCK